MNIVGDHISSATVIYDVILNPMSVKETLTDLIFIETACIVEGLILIYQTFRELEKTVLCWAAKIEIRVLKFT